MAAIPGVLALLWSFAQAPLAHTHRHDPVHRHATAMPHSHLGLPAGHERALDAPDDDDDVELVPWVLNTGGSVQPFVAVATGAAAIAVAVNRYELVRAPSPRAHDPPGLLLLPARAPPV